MAIYIKQIIPYLELKIAATLMGQKSLSPFELKNIRHGTITPVIYIGLTDCILLMT